MFGATRYPVPRRLKMVRSFPPQNFIPSKAPPDLAIAYGHMLNLMVASPSTGTVVVTMGRTYGQSLFVSRVDVLSYPTRKQCTHTGCVPGGGLAPPSWCGGRSYDEAFGLSALWEYDCGTERNQSR